MNLMGEMIVALSKVEGPSHSILDQLSSLLASKMKEIPLAEGTIRIGVVLVGTMQRHLISLL